MSFSAKKGLPASFLPLLGVTTLVAGVIIALNLHIAILAVVVTAPLMIYFYFVKKILIKEPDYNAIDSVYYFGFSLTIVTLATSAIIHFGLSSDIEDLQNLNLVFSQFGVGLLVTCLGLILRLFLLASLSQQNMDQEQNERQSLINDMIDLRKEITGFAHELKDININLKNQQKLLNLEIVDSLKTATQKFSDQSAHVQNVLIEHQKQKTLELMQYQEELQKSFYAHMQGMNDQLYNNMQQANQSHLAYVEKSQKHLLDLATNIGTTIQNLALPSVAESAKKASQQLVGAYSDMQDNIGHFNNELQDMTKRYTSLHEQHQVQLQSTLKSTKDSVDAVNYALIEVAKNTTEHMNQSNKTKRLEKMAD
jgi:hypothetical protein